MKRGVGWGWDYVGSQLGIVDFDHDFAIHVDEGEKQALVVLICSREVSLMIEDEVRSERWMGSEIESIFDKLTND